VGGDIDAHGDPERRVVVGAPRAVIERNRREVFVPQRAGGGGKRNIRDCVSVYLFGHRVVTFRNARVRAAYTFGSNSEQALFSGSLRMMPIERPDVLASCERASS